MKWGSKSSQLQRWPIGAFEHHLTVQHLGASQQAPKKKSERARNSRQIFIIQPPNAGASPMPSTPVPPKSSRTLQRHSRRGGVTSEALRGQPQFVAAQLSLQLEHVWTTFEPLRQGILNPEHEMLWTCGTFGLQMLWDAYFVTFWPSN